MKDESRTDIFFPFESAVSELDRDLRERSECSAIIPRWTLRSRRGKAAGAKLCSGF